MIMVNTIPKLCCSVAGEASGLGVKMHNAGYEAKGWKTTKGWRMLLHQALKQFELYTGEEMGEVLKEGLNS